MKKLNTIFSFVLLSFCLFINVSNATLIENESYPATNTGTTSENLSSLNGYTKAQCGTILRNYLSDTSNETYKADFETFKNAFMVDYDSYFVNINTGSSGSYYNIYFFNKTDFQMCYAFDDSVQYKFFPSQGNYLNIRTHQDASYNGNFSYIYRYTVTSAGIQNYTKSSNVSYFETNANIYNIVITGDTFYWDGTYYYEAESDEPETPTMPTNAEIASAVQMFYNSVYNLPNIAFDDFVVLYDNTTGLYTYIGHTLDTALGQVIVEPNGYYEGYKYDVQWWKFFIDEQNNNFLDQFSNYYVYTSDGTIDNLKYVGDSNISGLIEKSGPWATSNTVIVYSTNDYPVKYVTFSEDSPDPDIQTGTIQGDQYTYDENLDITDNQYNPLDNFISINYPSTLVGNADFDSFLNTFDENKDVLILPQSANWVILANTSLFSYFGSFIIMCTLFIIIERIMRG